MISNQSNIHQHSFKALDIHRNSIKILEQPVQKLSNHTKKYFKRNDELHHRFPEINQKELLIDDFCCAFKRGVTLSQGRLYITKKRLCFYSQILGIKQRIVLCLEDIDSILPKSELGFIPNAIEIMSDFKRYCFVSFLKRDLAFQQVSLVWNGYIKPISIDSSRPLMIKTSIYTPSNVQKPIECDNGLQLELKPKLHTANPLKSNKLDINTTISDPIPILEKNLILNDESYKCIQMKPENILSDTIMIHKSKIKSIYKYINSNTKIVSYYVMISILIIYAIFYVIGLRNQLQILELKLDQLIHSNDHSSP
ncbi:hypothetical protein BC833DRAFT_564277 [Globomyces pollinis-pini]|nr:hypothetical protein BC833DRAFT_564277 [Globomyces pollinis-pini]